MLQDLKVIRAADLFAGCGGTSWGLKRASVRLDKLLRLWAVNHNLKAISTHRLNFPEAVHSRDSLFDLNPQALCPEGKIELLWASPECTNHGGTRGDKPCDEVSRSTANCVLKWVASVRPEVVLVENVKAFTKWGPLDSKGRPVEARKGEFFDAWVQSFRDQGYDIAWNLLVAADFGDPTSRERLMVQAVRRDSGLRIVWPKPVYGPGTGRRHRGCGDIVDLHNLGHSIFRRKKPLVRNTIRRIEAGFSKQGIPPFIWHFMQTGKMPFDIHIDDTPKGFVVVLRGTEERQINATNYTLEDPLSAITAGGRHHRLVQPVISCRRGTSEAHLNASPIFLNEPLRAVATKPHFDLHQAFILGQQSCSVARPLALPAPTVATAGAIRLVQSMEADSEDLPYVFLNGEKRSLDIFSRMLQPVELARAQGFPAGYKFTGTVEDILRQIGNAVPPAMSEALALAVITQSEDVSILAEPLPGWTLWS